MKQLDPVHFKDWKFVGVDPDPGFDPAHNEAVIERTIKAAEAQRRAKRRKFQEGLAERSEALATYLNSVGQGGKESNITRYFGKKYQAYLAGKHALERLKDGLTSLGPDGGVIRRPGEVVE